MADLCVYGESNVIVFIINYCKNFNASFSLLNRLKLSSVYLR